MSMAFQVAIPRKTCLWPCRGADFGLTIIVKSDRLLVYIEAIILRDRKAVLVPKSSAETDVITLVHLPDQLAGIFLKIVSKNPSKPIST